MKPCELPCEKCGSADVYRRFIARDSVRHADSASEYRKYERRALGSSYERFANRDLIEHQCRTCGYQWRTPTLKKSKEPTHD